jgi:hypothetical protein
MDSRRSQERHNPTSDCDFYMMSNLESTRTGLPFVVWITTLGGALSDVYVMTSRSFAAIPSEMVTVAIFPTVHVVEGVMNASDLKLLSKWVDLNREVLIGHWAGEIPYASSIEAINAIVPIPNMDSDLEV